MFCCLFDVWNWTKTHINSHASLDSDDPEQITSQTRKLGLVVIRGTQVSLVSPEEGTEEIANPFLQAEEEEEVEGVAVGAGAGEEGWRT